MARVTITLRSNELEALVTLAQRERREPRAQAAVIIKRELEKCGLLPTDRPPTATPTPPQPQPQSVEVAHVQA